MSRYDWKLGLRESSEEVNQKSNRICKFALFFFFSLLRFLVPLGITIKFVFSLLVFLRLYVYKLQIHSCPIRDNVRRGIYVKRFKLKAVSHWGCPRSRKIHVPPSCGTRFTRTRMCSSLSLSLFTLLPFHFIFILLYVISTKFFRIKELCDILFLRPVKRVSSITLSCPPFSPCNNLTIILL